MTIWSIEIKELENLYDSLKGYFPYLDKELERLFFTEDANVVMLYSRRCLEVIITDLCECELKRPRKTEPLKGIIDKLYSEEKVPSHIITSMHSLNSLSTYGTHPKDFDPEQVKPVLNNLAIIIRWYLKYKDPHIISKTKPDSYYDINQTDHLKPTDISMPIAAIHHEKSIVVLPFQNISPEKDQDYFCDGITEEIINTLTHIEKLRVIARTTTFAFKDKYEDVRRIGKELGVETILEGSLRKSGDKLRITAKLIKVSDGSHIWSEKYDRKMKDVFEIQDEISLAIVKELKIQLFEGERVKILKGKTENLKAFNYYLKGRFYWNNSRTNEGIKNTIHCFEQAIETDPDYALAYAGLAYAYITLSDWGYIQAKRIAPKIKELLIKSIELDNTLAENHSSMMYYYAVFEWDWQKAEMESRKAIELNPKSAEVHHFYSLFQTFLGDFNNAIEHNRRALELDPFSLVFNYANGLILYMFHKYDEAIKQFRETLEIDNSFLIVYFWISITYIQKGLYSEAVEEYQNYLLRNEFTKKYVPVVDDVFKRSGIEGFLLWLVNEGIGLEKGIYHQPYHLANCYALLNKKEIAFQLLEEACEQQLSRVAWVKVDPGFDNLRNDPRFSILLEKVGLK